jgi:hypothetical protein
MLKRLGLNRHVSEADLTALWADIRLGVATQTAAASHVRDCSACRSRLAALSNWLDGLRTDARHEADEAFTRERLTVQHAQILRRLEAMERPARVLAFPRFKNAISAGRHVGRQHWIASAAAAGLIVGIGLGQTLNFRITSVPDRFSSAPQIVRSTAGTDGLILQPISAVSDELFLYDDEPTAATEHIPESLRSLHEITPSARDYSPR